MNMTRSAILCAAVLCWTTDRAQADTMHVVADTNANLTAVNQNNGADVSLPVRNTGAGGIRRAYVRFDLSALPPGTSIARATLRLYVNSVPTPGTLEVRSLSNPWDESTLTAANAPAFGSTLATFSVQASDLDQFVIVDITSTVQGWLSGTPNQGIAIIPSASGLVRVAFDSKEATATSHGPELEIVPLGTEVTIGTGLLGGPITGSGTLSLDLGFTDARYARLNAPNTFTGQQVFNNLIGSSAVVGNTFSPLSAYGLLGYAQAATGNTSGVTGASVSPTGIGVVGIGEALSGPSAGVRGSVLSSAGSAGVFDNLAGGRILTGAVNGATRFRVEGNGSIFNDGGITAQGTITAPSFVGNGSGLTNIAAVTQVATGTGLLGGAVTSTGTISLDTDFTDSRYSQLSAPNTFTGQQVFNNAIGSSAVVGNTYSPLSAYGLLGYAHAATGDTSGVTGASASDSGVGVAGIGEATTGATTGVRGSVASAAGTAGVFDNAAGGRLITGAVNGATRFRVEGSGAIFNDGGITAQGTVTAPAFVGDGSGLTNIPPGPQGIQGPQGPAGPQGLQGPAGAGSVTLVDVGIGLSGGPISTTGTLSLDTDFTDARYFRLNQSNSTLGQQTFTNDAGASAVVGFSTHANSAHAILGYAQSTTGAVSGVVGASASDVGVGVQGIAEATAGGTLGVRGSVASPGGIAGLFDNSSGGRILAGAVNGATRFRVEGNGAIFNDGGITAQGTVTASAFVGDGSALTNIPAGPQGIQGVQGPIGPQGSAGPAGPQGPQGVPYVRTIVVSPVPGDEAASGAALLAAMASITDNSVSNRWLLKVEPGVYDLGNGTGLAMKPYVDLEGSGASVTMLGKSGDGSLGIGTVQLADNSELREVWVDNHGAASWAVAIAIVGTTNARIRHVTASASGGGTGTYAVYANAGIATIENSTVIGGGSTPSSIGIIAAGASNLTIKNCNVVASTQSGEATGIHNSWSFIRLTDSVIEGKGGGTARGFYVEGMGNGPNTVDTLIVNSELRATQGSTTYGLESAGGGTAQIFGSRLIGGTAGMHNRMSTYQSGTTTVRATGSSFEGATGIVTTGGGYETYVGGGRIVNGVSGGAYKCTFVLGSSFDALTSTCQP